MGTAAWAASADASSRRRLRCASSSSSTASAVSPVNVRTPRPIVVVPFERDQARSQRAAARAARSRFRRAARIHPGDEHRQVAETALARLVQHAKAVLRRRRDERRTDRGRDGPLTAFLNLRQRSASDAPSSASARAAGEPSRSAIARSSGCLRLGDARALEQTRVDGGGAGAAGRAATRPPPGAARAARSRCAAVERRGVPSRLPAARRASSARPRSASSASSADSAVCFSRANPPARLGRGDLRPERRDVERSHAGTETGDLDGQLLGPLGRRRLEGERPQPLRHLGLDVPGPLDLRADPGELQLGAMATALEPTEPGGLLDQCPPFLRLRGEDRLHAPLRDDRAHRRAEADVERSSTTSIRRTCAPLTRYAPPPRCRRRTIETPRSRSPAADRPRCRTELDLAVVGGRPRDGAVEENVVGLGARSLGASEPAAQISASAMFDCRIRWDRRRPRHPAPT